MKIENGKFDFQGDKASTCRAHFLRSIY